MPRMERVDDGPEITADDAYFWLNELYKQALRNHDFTQWEIGFISGVKDRVNQGLPPSKLQKESLRTLYNKTFGSIGHKA
jgi:hypothetical protein